MYKPLYYDSNPFGLHSTSQLICATKPRHCAKKNTTLRVCKSPGPQLTILHSSIHTMKTGQKLYKLAVDMGLPKDTKFVCDGYTGAPIIRMKGPTFAWVKSKFNMRAGDDPDQIVGLCSMKVGGTKVKLIVEFEDAVLGVQRKICLRGSRWSRNFDIFLGDPKSSPRIGKMFRPRGKVTGAEHKDDYHIHIAEGVDMALILAMCLTLDTYLCKW